MTAIMRTVDAIRSEASRREPTTVPKRIQGERRPSAVRVRSEATPTSGWISMVRPTPTEVMIDSDWARDALKSARILSWRSWSAVAVAVPASMACCSVVSCWRSTPESGPVNQRANSRIWTWLGSRMPATEPQIAVTASVSSVYQVR